MSHFYGINGHPDYTWTAQTWVDKCHQIGCKRIRMDTWGADTTMVPRIADLQAAIQALDPLIDIMPAITMGFNTTTGTESSNYMDGYNAGRYVAQQLGPKGITNYECGNELLTDDRVWPNGAALGLAGDVRSQYASGAPWACLRGMLRGMMDGVKSVDASYRVGINYTVCQIAASDMMWNGEESNGTTGWPVVRGDFITWHNYRVYGSLWDMGTNGHGSNFNLMSYISATYGVPIMITEWNSNPEDNDMVATNWMNSFHQNAWDNRIAQKIESVQYYQADGQAPQYGLFFNPAKTAAYANFTAAHPNP
jgi:hypothetical protein